MTKPTDREHLFDHWTLPEVRLTDDMVPDVPLTAEARERVDTFVQSLLHRRQARLVTGVRHIADVEPLGLPKHARLMTLANLHRAAALMAENRIPPGKVDGYGYGYQVSVPVLRLAELRCDEAFARAEAEGFVRVAERPWWEYGHAVLPDGRHMALSEAEQVDPRFAGARPSWLLIPAPQGGAGGAAYMGDLSADETMGSGGAPGSPLGFREGGSVSHLSSTTARGRRCPDDKYIGDTVAIGEAPTCAECRNWLERTGGGTP